MKTLWQNLKMKNSLHCHKILDPEKVKLCIKEQLTNCFFSKNHRHLQTENVTEHLSVGETGEGEMGVGETGQIIGKTGVGEMGVIPDLTWPGGKHPRLKIDLALAYGATSFIFIPNLCKLCLIRILYSNFDTFHNS